MSLSLYSWQVCGLSSYSWQVRGLYLYSWQVCELSLYFWQVHGLSLNSWEVYGLSLYSWQVCGLSLYSWQVCGLSLYSWQVRGFSTFPVLIRISAYKLEPRWESLSTARKWQENKISALISRSHFGIIVLAKSNGFSVSYTVYHLPCINWGMVWGLRVKDCLSRRLSRSVQAAFVIFVFSIKKSQNPTMHQSHLSLLRNWCSESMVTQALNVLSIMIICFWEHGKKTE